MVMIFVLFSTILVLVNGNLTNRHAFYRDINRVELDARRVFGGDLADLTHYPHVVALLDRYWSIRCSGSAITPYWALTAAHCVTPQLAYIKYNTQEPASSDGESTRILYLYRHPRYKVVQEDEGRGMDVTLLHHDVGLIRAQNEMKMKVPLSPISSMGQYKISDLDGEELTIVGFGRTETSARTAGEQLFAVSLKMVSCERSTWVHCICGVSTPGKPKGVCSGDSGGPVMYRNVQVGVTSMGPVECAFTPRSEPEPGATNVFTSTFHYVALFNATIADSEAEIRKKQALRKVKSYRGSSVATALKSHVFLILVTLFIAHL